MKRPQTKFNADVTPKSLGQKS